MTLTVCLGAYILRYIDGGAYHWTFLNWALGLKDIGCRIIWLDSVLPSARAEKVRFDVNELKRRLKFYDLGDDPVVIRQDGECLPFELGCLNLSAATQADLFINLGYDLPASVVRAFRRSVFVDIDPGLTQTWINLGQLEIAEHDTYFSYGETVEHSRVIPSCGRHWSYTPPPVFLPAWQPKPAMPHASYTTVSNWWGDGDWIELGGTLVDNSKRAAFLEFLSLPSRTTARLELAVPLSSGNADNAERKQLERHGSNVAHVLQVSATPDAFQSYVQQSRGEFSCMKRGYSLLQTAWTSDRTINYLAAGRPAIIQATGPSRFLPDSEGLLRFQTIEDAARALQSVESDYARHSQSARALAEKYFDSRKVIPTVLEKALE